MFPKNPEAELGLIRSKSDTAEAFVIAMSVLVSSTQGGTPLTALLTLRGTISRLSPQPDSLSVQSKSPRPHGGVAFRSPLQRGLRRPIEHRRRLGLKAAEMGALHPEGWLFQR